MEDNNRRYFAGCDIGSTTGKAVILDGNRVVGGSLMRCLPRPEETAKAVLEEALSDAGLREPGDVERIIATGYGRVRVNFANDNVSEITCHARGVGHLDSDVRTLIDIGGQDCKVISVGEGGKVLDYAMNDKCAAGTGRFFEAMARVLNMNLESLARSALDGTSPESITSQCSVFAESEVITLLNEGREIENISAGVHEAIAGRLASLTFQVGVEEKVMVAGGCAKNPGLLRALENKLEVDVGLPEIDPQLVGALGAALLASGA